jgi:hypothetical protein
MKRDSSWEDKMIYHYERAVDIINSNDGDERFHGDINFLFTNIAERLAATYSTTQGETRRNISLSCTGWLKRSTKMIEL